jgi:hypothetical protein
MPVYFTYQLESGRNALKIGYSSDIWRRLKELQTGNPSKLQIVGWILAHDERSLERDLHKKFASYRRGGEWFEIEPAHIISVILRSGIKGFVTKNSDAFAVISHDKDAVPEFAGVWEWGDLELEECCPFCGCCCGIHYQEASGMHYCLNCKTLTNFEDVTL